MLVLRFYMVRIVRLRFALRLRAFCEKNIITHFYSFVYFLPFILSNTTSHIYTPAFYLLWQAILFHHSSTPGCVACQRRGAVGGSSSVVRLSLLLAFPFSPNQWATTSIIAVFSISRAVNYAQLETDLIIVYIDDTRNGWCYYLTLVSVLMKPRSEPGWHPGSGLYPETRVRGVVIIIPGNQWKLALFRGG